MSPGGALRGGERSDARGLLDVEVREHRLARLLAHVHEADARAEEDEGDAGADGVSNGDASNARRTFETIRAALTSEEGGFDLVEQSDMPFLIKEHDRKYQWGCSHATVWRRRRREKHA